MLLPGNRNYFRHFLIEIENILYMYHLTHDTAIPEGKLDIELYGIFPAHRAEEFPSHPTCKLFKSSYTGN